MGSLVDAAGRASAAGQAVKAGTNTSGLADGIRATRGGGDGVVVPSPALDHDLCLLERVENLAIQEFVPQASVEALDMAFSHGEPG